MRISENPVAAALEFKALRQPNWIPRLGLLAIVASAGVYILMITTQYFLCNNGLDWPTRAEELALFVNVLQAILLMIFTLGPLYLVTFNFTFLNSLRQGSCVEEVLGTRTLPMELTDGAVLRSVRDLRASGLLWAGPIAAPLLHAAGGSRALELAVLWPVLLGLWLLAAAYALQLFPAWSERGRSSQSWFTAIPALACLALAGGLTALCAGQPAAPSLIFCLTVLIVVERSLAALGWACSGRAWSWWRARVAPTRRDRSSGLYVRWARDSVSWREFARRGGSVVSHHWAAIMLGLCLLPLTKPVILTGVLFTYFLCNSVQAAMAAAHIVCQERENRTFEPLLETHMSADDFVDGAAWAASLPRSVENVVLTVWATALLLSRAEFSMAGVVALVGLIACLTPGCTAVFGAVAGIAESSRRECYFSVVYHLGTWFSMVGQAAVYAALASAILGEGAVLLAGVFMWLCYVTFPRSVRRVALKHLQRKHNFVVVAS